MHTSPTMMRQSGPVDKYQMRFAVRAQKMLQKQALEAQVKGRCPHCNSTGLQSWGSYARQVRVMTADGQTTVELRIPRLRCPHCGHTHAVIIPGLVPYRWYGLAFILCVAVRYLSGSGTVTAICDHFQIAVGTLYRWMETVREHVRFLEGVSTSDAQIRRLAKEAMSRLADAMLAHHHQVLLENLRSA